MQKESRPDDSAIKITMHKMRLPYLPCSLIGSLLQLKPPHPPAPKQIRLSMATGTFASNFSQMNPIWRYHHTCIYTIHLKKQAFYYQKKKKKSRPFHLIWNTITHNKHVRKHGSELQRTPEYNRTILTGNITLWRNPTANSPTKPFYHINTIIQNLTLQFISLKKDKYKKAHQTSM